MWDGQDLVFQIELREEARGLLTAMLPMRSSTGTLRHITWNATPIAYTIETIKGLAYAFFPANSGIYRVRFAPAAP